MIILIGVLLLAIFVLAAYGTLTFAAALIDGAHAGPGSWGLHQVRGRHTTGRHRLATAV